MCKLSFPRRLVHPSALSRSLSIVAGTLALASVSLPGWAEEPQVKPSDWGISVFGAEKCMGALQNPVNDLSAVRDCAVEQLVYYVADSALQLVEQHGKANFGEHFHISRRLGLTASTGTLSADLDAVFPLTAHSYTDAETPTRSLFLQNGVTRWQDAQGLQRSDVRLGIVHRLAFGGDKLVDGIFGSSLFVQENLERGHARMVAGLEYLDRWSQSSINYYLPVTGWRPGRYGYEERALEGVELSYVADLTSAISVSSGYGLWEYGPASDSWAGRGRIEVHWQPHSWFEFRSGWEGIGTSEDAMALHASLKIPLGGVRSNETSLRWAGLGRRAQAFTTDSDDKRLWRAVDHMGEIEVGERQASPTQTDGSASPQPTGEANGLHISKLSRPLDCKAARLSDC